MQRQQAANNGKIDRTTQYAVEVLAGKIRAGETVKKACRRHVENLKESKSNAEYKYYFDVAEAEDIINFAETLTIAEGEEAQSVTAISVSVFHSGIIKRMEDKGKRI